MHRENGIFYKFQELQESLSSVHTISVYTSSSECCEMWRRGRVLQGVGVLIHLEPGLWYSNSGAGPCTAHSTYCTSGPLAISLSLSHTLSQPPVSGSNTVLTATFINSLSVRGRASLEGFNSVKSFVKVSLRINNIFLIFSFNIFKNFNFINSFLYCNLNFTYSENPYFISEKFIEFICLHCRPVCVFIFIWFSQYKFKNSIIS